MSEFLDRLRAELAARGSKIIDAGTAGIGIEFRDGHDVWWLLPGDPLSSVPVPPSADADPRAILEEYGRLDALRSRAIHAIRHHLADRGIRTVRLRSGHWPIQKGAVSSGLSVGASLTARFAGSDDVVAAVRGVFAYSMVRSPSPRRIQRCLAREGDPPDELPWSDEPPAIEMAQNPTAVLAVMGLCRAIRLCGETADESRLPRPEEMAEVVQPKGRIGRALARCAAALPDTRASLELVGGAMAIEFDDGLDCYRIHPRSRDLVARIRRDGPERAGDDLISEFRRLNADRARVIAAFRVALPRLGFHVQDEQARLHYGRGVREASLDLGEPLTGALRQGTAREAVRTFLATNPGLAEEVAEALAPESPEKLPEPRTAVLLPPEPPPIPIPQITELDLARVDQLARLILDRYLGQREVLGAFFDPLLYDPASDSWATRDDWLRAANRFRGEDFTNPAAELIRLELGVTVDVHGWLTTLGRVGRHGENSEAEIISVYRYRHEYPEIAKVWFAPGPFEDCPEAETRCGIGDWIAARDLAASIDPGDDDVWRPLSRLTPSALEVFFEAGQIERWRDRAVRAIDEAWDWTHFDEDLLRAAVVHRWAEVGEALHRNPYLFHALFTNDRMLIYSASRVFLAWSRLTPSIEIARLVGTLLGLDLRGRANIPAMAAVGAMAESRPDLVSQIADVWLTELQRSLAIAWTRSRRLAEA
jgi:hypothetical protein